jgi:hypothetical protein
MTWIDELPVIPVIQYSINPRSAGTQKKAPEPGEAHF